MPITWNILHEERLVLARAEGVVRLAHVEAYLDALVTEGAMPYAKLFDATDMQPEATDQDVMLLGARMSAYVATLPGGPLAFAATSDEARHFISRYLNLTAAKRPVKIFDSAADARRWLDGQPR